MNLRNNKVNFLRPRSRLMSPETAEVSTDERTDGRMDGRGEIMQCITRRSAGRCLKVSNIWGQTGNVVHTARGGGVNLM